MLSFSDRSSVDLNNMNLFTKCLKNEKKSYEENINVYFFFVYKIMRILLNFILDIIVFLNIYVFFLNYRMVRL